MRWESHVRFGGRAGETHPSKDGQGAPVRPIHPAGARGRPGGECLGGDRHGGQRRGPPGDRRLRYRDHGGHRGLDRVPARAGGPGLGGVELVISDAHGGIKAAIASVFSEASWQRCRTHFMANLASRCAKGNWPMIATLVRSIFEQPDRDATWSQLGDVIDKLTGAGFCDVVIYLLDAADDILAFSAFPVEHWPKIRSNNPQERLNKEIRRRTDVVGIFPNRAAVIRLVGALLAEQTDEWAITKRYMSAESLKTQKKSEPSAYDPRPSLDAATEEAATDAAT